MGDHWKPQNRAWNEGYRDGYRGNEPQVGKLDQYYTAYDVGRDDRIEDDEFLGSLRSEEEEATESGDFDSLTQSEREAIFGADKDRL